MTALDVFDSLFSNTMLHYPTYRPVTGTRYSQRVEGDCLLVDIDLPGVSIENIEVAQVDDSTVEIRAQRGEKSKINLAYTLAEGYDVTSLVPTLKLGVLTLKFNKSQGKQLKSFKVLTA